MFTPESAAINTIVDSVNSQAQNIHLEENISVDKNVYSSTERASRQSICGHINRQLCNKGTVNKSSDHEGNIIFFSCILYILFNVYFR